MSLRDYVGRDVREALNATPFRRVITYTPLFLLMLVAGLSAWFFGAEFPSWIWLPLVAIDLVVFAYVGRRWADEDLMDHRAE